MFFYYHIIILLSAVHWSNAVGAMKNLWNSTYTDQLKHDLLFKYDKFARPAQHFNMTTVKMGLVIKHIEIDEEKSMMIVIAWNKLGWIDEKLKWNASEYGGLQVLHIADHEIWQPDIVLYNSAQANNIDHYGNTHCLVFYDGTVIWVPPAQLPVFCDLDLTWWPYDTQSCHLYFGSWTFSGQQINLTMREENGEVEVDMEAGQWEVISAKGQRHEFIYKCCPEPYYRVDYTITVKRRTPAYHAILFTPVAMSIALTLAVFWLTPAATEKFLLSGVTAIIISMYLIYFSVRLPSVGIYTPVIVQFYSINLCLVCLSMVASVITHNLSRKVRSRPVPWVIKKFLTGRLGTFLALSTTKNSFLVQSYTDKNGEEMQECNLVREECSNMSPSRNDSDWLLLAIALDRIMFLIYLLIFTLIIIVCLI
ncbi:neuronal acetylcholine receptor subunit alpha-5-like [Lycorma delicatula]|uniref:neuronal acetylcholine receptor subunit alpha-5-like n=1 Tax=Lycorma delicatula TaxID=130591 RepID=UPI003F50D5D2